MKDKHELAIANLRERIMREQQDNIAMELLLCYLAPVSNFYINERQEVKITIRGSENIRKFKKRAKELGYGDRLKDSVV